MSEPLRCAVLLLAACAPRLPPGHVWVELSACGMDQEELEACRARGGSPGRPLTCTGVPVPEPPRAEARALERAYEAGARSCVCLGAQEYADCAATP